MNKSLTHSAVTKPTLTLVLIYSMRIAISTFILTNHTDCQIEKHVIMMMSLIFGPLGHFWYHLENL